MWNEIKKWAEQVTSNINKATPEQIKNNKKALTQAKLARNKWDKEHEEAKKSAENDINLDNLFPESQSSEKENKIKKMSHEQEMKKQQEELNKREQLKNRAEFLKNEIIRVQNIRYNLQNEQMNVDNNLHQEIGIVNNMIIQYRADLQRNNALLDFNQDGSLVITKKWVGTWNDRQIWFIPSNTSAHPSLTASLQGVPMQVGFDKQFYDFANVYTPRAQKIMQARQYQNNLGSNIQRINNDISWATQEINQINNYLHNSKI
ncbi:MAG: hypothetical protein ACD_49C00050G0015 [uncultured bacterium (gcode 4)]|uniref:Uncharacterized protein n=1 Tax=uncultured bacterium (gcode 4) TaxID=1234023 RepID=K2AE67_9BACT|nr:MAG: hypothetical protein ACD_49C00050G0015 [uncultured bacterium (gcode 4)]